MTALVVVETIAIIVLGLLVCGLLRSHAEILQALDALDGGAGSRSPARPVELRRSPPRSGSMTATDLVGTTPADETVQLGVVGTAHDTLVAFLSSACHTCSGLWRALRDPSSVNLPANTRLAIVTKGPEDESLLGIRELAPKGVPVVMSTQAWVDYEVPVTPYFVQIDGPSGRVIGQGSGATWDQVTSLLRQATDDDHARRDVTGEAGVDRKLLAAGIRPGDPSLYPSRARDNGGT